MSVDRTHGPKIRKINSLQIPPVSREVLANGIELIEVNMGTQNLLQLEVIFRGGRINERQKGASRAVARILKEGTASYTGAEIAEMIDFYGANISSGASLDYSYIKIFTLTKYFHDLLPILLEVIYQPVFPNEELQKYKENNIQKLKVEMAKSELVAYKTITERLYGPDHPYGYNSSDKIYQDLTTESLIEYYRETYGTDNCIVIMSGKVTDDIRVAVRTAFEQQIRKDVPIHYTQVLPVLAPSYREHIGAEDDLQTAIKIGRHLFDRDHPDFNDMFILNTILGGYFGSRLMSSLREEKGYTYNIYSSIDMMIYSGYFNISTEVGNAYVEKTIEGIYEEMQLLVDEPVEEEELDMVRNYLSGNFLNMIDGPFKVAGMSKVIALNGLDFEFYQSLMERIHKVTSEELQLLAQKYFRKEDMIEIIVGNP